MPTINLQGLGSVTVGPEFLKLSPEEQSRTVDEIAVHIKGANGRIAGAFDASNSVRQVDKLSAPYNGLMVSRDRLGDIHPGSIPQGVMQGVMNMPKDIAGAVQTVGDVAAGRTNAMVPDTGQGVTNPVVENAAKTLAPLAMPLTPGLRAGEGWAAAQTGRGFRRPPAPTREELRAAGSGGFQSAFNMGVDFNPQAMASFASVGRAHLDQLHFNDVSAPHTYKILQQLENPKGPYVPFSGLEQFRRQLYAGATSGSDRAAAKIVADGVDKLMQEPPAASVMAGPAAEAGATVQEARGNWAALERSKEVAGKQQRAQRRAWATNSGKNTDNTLRQRVADIRDQIDAGKLRGFSQAEIAQMDAFIKGGSGRNFLRNWSNRLGGGGGAMSTLTAMSGLGTAGYLGGGELGAVAGVAAPTIGWLMKTGENKLARQGMTAIDENIRRRSPLGQQMAANAPVNPVSPEMRALLMRSSLLYGPNAQQGGGGY